MLRKQQEQNHQGLDLLEQELQLPQGKEWNLSLVLLPSSYLVVDVPFHQQLNIQFNL
jgi:hypothetical protein